jgi:hypothetical protein
VANGRYTSDFQGEIGRTYRVEVTVPERSGYPSGTWVSAAEALNRCNDADSIYSQYLPRAPFQQEGRYVFLHWSEAAGKGDHYRVRIFRNDTLQNQTFDLTVFNDDFNDGFVFPTPPSIPPFRLRVRTPWACTTKLSWAASAWGSTATSTCFASKRFKWEDYLILRPRPLWAIFTEKVTKTTTRSATSTRARFAPQR